MCKCTPEIRTPFCGKGECVWPKEKQNDLLPTMSIEAKTEMVKTKGGGWEWEITVHVGGSDDVRRHCSMIFNDKKRCLIDMFSKYTQTIDKLIGEMSCEGE